MLRFGGPRWPGPSWCNSGVSVGRETTLGARAHAPAASLCAGPRRDLGCYTRSTEIQRNRNFLPPPGVRGPAGAGVRVRLSAGMSPGSVCWDPEVAGRRQKCEPQGATQSHEIHWVSLCDSLRGQHTQTAMVARGHCRSLGTGSPLAAGSVAGGHDDGLALTLRPCVRSPESHGTRKQLGRLRSQLRTSLLGSPAGTHGAIAATAHAHCEPGRNLGVGNTNEGGTFSGSPPAPGKATILEPDGEWVTDAGCPPAPTA